MSFDPFGDFEQRGYLRNLLGEKDPDQVKLMEHASFTLGIDDAFAHLEHRGNVTYDDLLEVHRILFASAYPWAGEDRMATAPDLAVSRGPVLFAAPSDIRRSIDYGLKLAQDKKTMADSPGLVMGYLAHGHPFLDGNGRALMVTHTHLAERAGISIAWNRTNKNDYLVALTRELEDPNAGHLDDYLQPFISDALGQDRLVAHLLGVPGLGSSQERLPENEVLGKMSDEDVQARYAQYEAKREQSKDRGGRGR